MLGSLVGAVLLAVSVSAQAEQPADALRACLADTTSGKDRKDLARWIFLGIAAHPEMKQYASSTAAAVVDDSSRTMAALVTRLLTESCAKQAKAVAQSGQSAQSMQLAFQGLGQLAMQELMTDKSVQDAMGLFERYLDQERFKKALGDK
jgi:hypothetical protein